MPDVAYNGGLDHFFDWEDGLVGPWGWLLVEGTAYTPDRTSTSIFVIPQVDVDGYTRAVVTDPVRAVDDATSQVRFFCDDPTFGSPETGATVSGLVLFHCGDPADDPLDVEAAQPVAYYQIFPTRSTNGTPFSVELSAPIAHYEQGV